METSAAACDETVSTDPRVAEAGDCDDAGRVEKHERAEQGAGATVTALAEEQRNWYKCGNVLRHAGVFPTFRTYLWFLMWANDAFNMGLAKADMEKATVTITADAADGHDDSDGTDAVVRIDSADGHDDSDGTDAVVRIDSAFKPWFARVEYVVNGKPYTIVSV